VLANARLLLPLSDTAARTAEGLIERRKRATAPASITLPIPLERLPGAAVRDLDAVAYAANPAKRGLDLLCQAWRLARPADGVLLVSGIDRERALRWLSGIGVDEPPGIQWAGELRREDWLSRVARARIFVSAARYEDWGIAQLEALASGTPLVTVPTPGPNEALALARRLAPRLVAPTSTAEALAAAIEEGLSLSDSGRLAYAEAADSLLEPYRPEAVQQVVTQAVVPELLRSSA
jgi:glycosyltransferase involved in cell wall biosynthesis